MDKQLATNTLSRYQFWLLALISFLTLGLGTFVYRHIEDLSWVDSLYFSTITLTTIGYGDITPQTDAGKLFTVFYVIVGIAIIGAFANAFIRRAANRRHDHESRIARVFNHFRNKED